MKISVPTYVGCIFVSIMFAFLSCSSLNKSKGNSSETLNIDTSITVGKVVKNDSCGYILEVVESGETIYFLPLNLPSQFEKQGARIRFTYVLSRAKQPSGCLVDKVVTLENIEKVNP